MTKTMTIEDAQANLNDLIDEVNRTRSAVIITDGRGDQVVMVSAAEWASMTEGAGLARSPRTARCFFQNLARALGRKG